MITIILGIIFIAFAVFAVLPMGPLAWGADVISFLKGCTPVMAILFGIICFLIGAADIKDKKEAKEEEMQEAESEKEVE